MVLSHSFIFIGIIIQQFGHLCKKIDSFLLFWHNGNGDDVMHLKRAVAIFLAICIFASCFTSCKEKEPVLLHADEVALAEKCEHKFSTAEEKTKTV